MSRQHVARRLPLAGVAARLCILALGVTLGAGCASHATPTAALTHAAASPEALGRELLARLARRDVDGVRQLALTRDEFEAHVWPHLPASRPDTNMPLSFVWGRLQQQSEGRLAQIVATHGGTPLTFVALEFTGEASQYGDVHVRRKSVLTVRTATGEVERLTLFGSMLRHGEAYKVFSYVTD